MVQLGLLNYNPIPIFMWKLSFSVDILYQGMYIGEKQTRSKYLYYSKLHSFNI
eukprot:UN13843